MDDDDLVMESTTDTPEQISEGLGVDYAPPVETADAVDQPGDDSAGAGIDAGDEVDASESGDADAAPVGEVTPSASRGTAPRRAPRPQKKTVDGAAAAARRKATARVSVLEEENAALRERLREVAVNPGAGRREDIEDRVETRREARTAPVVVTADQVGDEHPRVAAVLAKVTALGPKPKQDAYDDYEKFEEVRDNWLQERARLLAKADFVREDVAHQLSIEQDEANRAAEATAKAFEKSVNAAKGRHADYQDVMDEANERGLKVSRDVGQALMESEHGAEVLYWLATHPAEVDRINRLSTHRQLAEVGIIEGRVAASMRPASRMAGAQVGSNGRPVRVTRAPEPQETLLGDFGTGPKGKDLNDPNLSQAEYNRLRDEMDRESGRRPH